MMTTIWRVSHFSMQSQTPEDCETRDDGPDRSAFDLLHKGVQRQLWEMKWQSLRLLQVKAIKAILGTERDIILEAGTASGKTEAAFLPILSRIADEPTGSVRAMYIGPLKALINDQFRRVADLCSHLDVPVFHWHGDVSAREKKQLVEQPGGVLLITPESLESLFVNRSEYLPRLFGGLRFVVIDELHSFLDNERGLHLRSLLSRVKQLMADMVDVESYRTVGLSATIGDVAVGQKFMRPDAPDDVLHLADTQDAKEMKYRIYGYRIPAISEKKDDQADGTAADENGDDPLEPFLHNMADDIVRHCKGHSNLVFANSKADVEVFADFAKQIAEQQHLRDLFLVHHGSLSALIREDAEETMKSGQVATAFCSSTLEMGIDIGSVTMVGQIGPSWSVSSQLQRMGRSGRKESDPRIMRVYVECGEPTPQSDVFDRLQLPLIQAIAITELMLGKWLEPPSFPVCDLSTLTQQIISIISETGGLAADMLYGRLCVRGAFGDISRDMFRHLLRNLGGQDVINQMGNGDLILGLKGEVLRRDKGFYACFPTEEEFTILHDGKVLGSLQVIPRDRDHLLFAGRRWIVTDVDKEKKEIHVEPARGWKRPKFTGGPGEVHERVRQKMRAILTSDQQYRYLDEQASNLLAGARQAAADASVCSQPIVELGPRCSALMTWTGSRIQETLTAMCNACGFRVIDEVVALSFSMPAGALRDVVRELHNRAWEPTTLAQYVSRRERRKYDWLLNQELLDICVSRSVLECDAALALLRNLVPAKGNQVGNSSRDVAIRTAESQVLSLQSGMAGDGPVYAKPRNPIHLVAGQDAFASLCCRLEQEPLLGLDVETTIWDKPRILCTIQLATPHETWIVDVLTLNDLGPIIPILDSPSPIKIIHHAAFECGVFEERGIHLQGIFDTCETSRSKRSDENKHALAECVFRELGMRMEKAYQKADWKRRPLPHALVEYAALDAEILIPLHARLSES